MAETVELNGVGDTCVIVEKVRAPNETCRLGTEAATGSSVSIER